MPHGLDATFEVVESWIESVKQDRALLLVCLERAGLDGAHEDASATIAQQLDAELATPPLEAMGLRELGEVGFDLQIGHRFFRERSSESVRKRTCK